ncbi:ABC transporter ATP-binding protein [Tepidimicrobium xylanilyticum]|uniref:Branched-chain amino acid transport system ATP-binding protein n=1 Tax=Tepidimicrobium xylanilyticum TaxID=1123352 RepID=A0A1H2TBK4_9FIRM|nr:ABC transporter ATP-binding protein [Tepidimicrobium xylanilyticum]SDW41200.1 branched-chain amino acid transport system ATP-binding protein [Tepidimicrobium xylanilyticum]
MLELKNIDVFYDNIQALKEVNLTVGEGEMVTLIGANGAGKSTTLRAISGLNKPKKGEIKFKGRVISSLKASDIVRMGISHVPEGRRIFANMTVMENLEMGAYIRGDRGNLKRDYDEVFSLFPRLKERKNQIAGTLSGGEQQMLAIGRALMAKPKYLLLDEPSMGLAPLIVKEIFSILENINKLGTTILLVEQNANMALNVTDRAYIIKNGKIELEGRSKDLLKDEKVKKAYLE